MRVLIVFHGWFPRPDRPVSGGALRAWHHAGALTAAGHEVHLLTREQDAVPGGPPTFRSGPDLLAHARRVRPEVVLCVQPEEAPALAPLGVPIAVDLYAPRLLEAQFQDTRGEEAVQTLRAIQAGDFFLFSNPRQRFYFLGLLAMAGVDLRDDRFGAVVPLVAPEGPPRRAPESPLFVLGGVSWPWIDPLEGLTRAVAHLRKRRRGKVLVLGGQPAVGSAAVRDLAAALPAGPRLEHRGPVPYADLLAIYAGATAALDLMAPTPERSLAVAFRHMDYLGCGLPMIVGAEHVLGDLLRETGAGLVGLPVEAAIDLVLDEPAAHEARAAAAAALARERFHRTACEAPLLAWLGSPSPRDRRAVPIAERAELAAQVAAALAAQGEAERTVARIEAEVGAKRAEVAGLVDQVRTLSVTNERLAGAMAEVAGFKREAIAVLGGAEACAREQAEALRAERAVLAADAAKKSGEIDALEREKQALVGQVLELRRRLERAESETERLRAAVSSRADALEMASLDAQKKSGEIDALEREKRLLAGDVVELRRGLERAEGEALQLRQAAAATAFALEAALLDAQKKSGEIDALEREKRLLAGDVVELRRQHERLGAEAAGLREAAASQADALEMALLDAQKKSGEIDALEREKRLLRDQIALGQRDVAATGAEAARLAVETARLAVALGEARDDLAKKAAEVAALAQERHGVREQLEEVRAYRADLETEARDAADQARQTGRALARAEADIAKKAAELDSSRQANLGLVEDRQAAQGALDAVKAELKRAEAEQRLTQQLLDRVRREVEADAAALLDARSDVAAKVAEHELTQRLLDRARQEAEAAVAALADARADATAKGVELTLLQRARAGMIADRDAAVGALDEVRVMALRHEAELRLTQGLLDEAREAQDRLGVQVASVAAELAAKAATQAALERACERERGRVERGEAQLERARAEIASQREALARAELLAGQGAARIEALEASLADTAADIAKKNTEIEAALSDRDRLERLVAELRVKR